jgi:acyl carrier protein
MDAEKRGPIVRSTSEARAVLAGALGMNTSDLPADVRLGNIEQWDSLAHVRLILQLEERLGRPLSTDEAISIDSEATIAAVLANRAS